MFVFILCLFLFLFLFYQSMTRCSEYCDREWEGSPPDPITLTMVDVTPCNIVTQFSHFAATYQSLVQSGLIMLNF